MVVKLSVFSQQRKYSVSMSQSENGIAAEVVERGEAGCCIWDNINSRSLGTCDCNIGTQCGCYCCPQEKRFDCMYVICDCSGGGGVTAISGQ